MHKNILYVIEMFLLVMNVCIFYLLDISELLFRMLYLFLRELIYTENCLLMYFSLYIPNVRYEHLCSSSYILKQKYVKNSFIYTHPVVFKKLKIRYRY